MNFLTIKQTLTEKKNTFSLKQSHLKSHSRLLSERIMAFVVSIQKYLFQQVLHSKYKTNEEQQSDHSCTCYNNIVSGRASVTGSYCLINMHILMPSCIVVGAQCFKLVLLRRRRVVAYPSIESLLPWYNDQLTHYF